MKDYRTQQALALSGNLKSSERRGEAMLPNDRLSVVPVPADYSGSRAGPVTRQMDFEDGAFGFNDPSGGLLYQKWTCRVINPKRSISYVQIQPDNGPAAIVYRAPFISEASLGFDQNMRVALAMVVGGASIFYWFDTVQQGYVVMTLGGSEIKSPRVGMDDKRLDGSDNNLLNDVILAYVRDKNLYYRQQRDRYGVERLLYEGVTGPLIKIGFTKGLRFQFMTGIE